ncbi:hypothetical protein R0381_002469 [Jeongeupia wiesaeckerbachi]|uniref:TadE/TadG family type IV pilus assembly protein n=1 Tax=Jeongeupia wiesaeckerbachi TaxID=3051218 RepID=UPI003D803380
MRARMRPRAQHGGVAIWAAMTLLPVLAMWTFAFEAGRYQSIQMRLHQAQTGAALVLAKEGPRATENVLGEVADAYVEQNMQAIVGDDVDVETGLLLSDDTVRLGARRPYAAWLNSGPVWRDVDQSVVAERMFRPVEASLVLDSSASMMSPTDAVAAVREGVQAYIASAFRDREQSRDFTINLISYAGMVNIGWSAKDRLVTPASRRIPPHLKDVAVENGWWHGDDLLHRAGAEGLRQGACVKRKPLSPGNEATYIRKVVEAPPGSPDDGFELQLEHGADRWGEPAAAATTYLEYSTGLDAIRDIGLQIPRAGRNVNPPSRWDKYAAHDLKNAVGAAYDCAHMPMLVASGNRKELVQRLDQYLPTATTGGDEGLAWGYRALHPAWRGVWSKTYPMDFDPRREKKLLLFSDGANVTGYGGGRSWVNGREVTLPNVIPPLCERMKQQGIEISVLLLDPGGWNFSDEAGTLRDYRNCASSPERFRLVNKTVDVIRFLREWGQREYRVRLVDTL